ncbi:signal peptidase II [Prochlorococcus sp. MIT 1307]|uniref:signal peptidase II n=1 Tax=Prochlorococcus sp. MIT 1307 TaxID=3096219 RepID=UPI002A75B671|nr:signal peptidase II [Prochlorococcus sp. MIT 1307]
MRKILLKRKFIFLLSTLVIASDQLSKIIAIQVLKEKQYLILIPNLIQLRLVQNTGAAFSLFNKSTHILGFLSLSVSIGLIIWIWRSKSFLTFRGLGLSFLLGGCIGNGIDRWRVGYVNDFLELIPINFPIFNLADIVINLAVICFFIEELVKYKKKMPDQPS